LVRCRKLVTPDRRNAFVCFQSDEHFAHRGNSSDGAEMSDRLDDYDFPLPDQLIAQRPPARREDARMMVLDRREETIAHRRFLICRISLGQASCSFSTTRGFCPRGAFLTTAKSSSFS
jgi:hypothetical protein